MEDVEAKKPKDMSSPVICKSDSEEGDTFSAAHIVNKRKPAVNTQAFTLKLNLVQKMD